jgi:creatinine amidohydrolase
VWMELGACVARAGIKKLVLFNSHGGQVSVMDIVARDLRTAHDLIVFSSNWFTLPLGEEVMNLFTPAEHRFGIHAGDMETSMMLALREKYVDMQHAQHFHTQAEERAKTYPILGNGTSAKLGWQMQDYNPYGGAGNATLATAAKGHAVIKAAGLQLARMLQEVSSLPLNTLNTQPNHSI